MTIASSDVDLACRIEAVKLVVALAGEDDDLQAIIPSDSTQEAVEFPTKSGQRLAVGLVMRPFVLGRGNVPQ